VVSVDPIKDHHGWIKDINEIKNTNVDFPLIADPDREVSLLYDMIHPNASATATVRSVFIIGPDKKVKLTFTYPAAIGRNFDEILRVIDALQLSAEHNISTPADWKPGDHVIVPNTITTEEATRKFDSEVSEVKAYLRFIPQPGNTMI
jgi:thioredoxin-dependent peroxiredoxin